MDYDIKLGYKSFTLEAVRAALLADKPVSQSDLNKIEWVMQYELCHQRVIPRYTGRVR